MALSVAGFTRLTSESFIKRPFESNGASMSLVSFLISPNSFCRKVESFGIPLEMDAQMFNCWQKVGQNFPRSLDHCFLFHGNATNYCGRFQGLKHWIVKKLNLQMSNKRRPGRLKKFQGLEIQGKDESAVHSEFHSEKPLSSEAMAPKVASERSAMTDLHEETSLSTTEIVESSLPSYHPSISGNFCTTGSPPSFQEMDSHDHNVQSGMVPSICIAVVGATGELARSKVFPALFALYYSGFIPENVAIFGYSRKDMTDEDLRSMIAGTLTCRVDHRENCGDKMDAFLRRTYYLNGGFNNKEGMAKLNARMEQIEGTSEANRIFYLSVPQEAFLDVASSLADNAQTQRGWNRIIVEKPFGFNALSSSQLTQSLLSKFNENQIYRIDHLLGKDLIENLTVLRFSNLVFEPLWSRRYIRNVQIIFSEDWEMEARGRYFSGYGIIWDIVHSHILQTIALFAMEPPLSLDGEDIRNEKLKVLRSIRKMELEDAVLGQYKAGSVDEKDVHLDTLTPTFFASALYIDNTRWDGVPFMIKAGIGLIKHSVEIRIQFHNVPGNIYRNHIQYNADLATNELILSGAPDESILVKVNNKIPGLGLQLDASKLNLLYKDKYNAEVPDSYEHLILDVINGDNHLFMRSDELAAAWDILTPILRGIDEKKIAPEIYEFGGRGPVSAFYLGAKHGVRWADD